MSMYSFVSTPSYSLLDLAHTARIICTSVLDVLYAVHIGTARLKLDEVSFVGFVAEKLVVFFSISF